MSAYRILWTVLAHCNPGSSDFRFSFSFSFSFGLKCKFRKLQHTQKSLFEKQPHSWSSRASYDSAWSITWHENVRRPIHTGLLMCVGTPSLTRPVATHLSCLLLSSFGRRMHKQEERELAGDCIPYDTKFLRDQTFAEWPSTKICWNHFHRSAYLGSHAHSHAKLFVAVFPVSASLCCCTCTMAFCWAVNLKSLLEWYMDCCSLFL